MVVLAALLAHGAFAAPPPNIVLMVIDDVGWADLSMNGGDFPSPNFDALAAGGVNLRRLYVQPVCSPTRSALMTGRYPFHTGMQHFTTLVPGSTAKLPLAPHKTLAEIMRGQGFSTAAIGKVSSRRRRRSLARPGLLLTPPHAPPPPTPTHPPTHPPTRAGSGTLATANGHIRRPAADSTPTSATSKGAPTTTTARSATASTSGATRRAPQTTARTQ